MLMHPEQVADLPIWAAGLPMVGSAILGAAAVELVARRIVPMNVRQDHSGAASAIFAVIGTAYAVSLAFVAMLAWEGYIKAQAVTDTEASLVQNVYQLVEDLDGPEMASMRHDIVAYAAAVVRTEWPAQARGEYVAETDPALSSVTRTALHLRPDNLADGDLHTLLLVVSGVLVLLVIVALSSPFRGDTRISAEPSERVLAHMEQE